MTTLLERERNTAVRERETTTEPPRIEPPKRAKRGWLPWMVSLLVIAVLAVGAIALIVINQEEVGPAAFGGIDGDMNQGYYQAGAVPTLTYQVMTEEMAEARFGPFPKPPLEYQVMTEEMAEARFGPFPALTPTFSDVEFPRLPPVAFE